MSFFAQTHNIYNVI